MLNCQPFPSWPQGSLDLQHMAQLEPGDWNECSMPYTPSEQLQEFFNDTTRARSLLITEDTYAEAACTWFAFLESSSW